MVDPNYLNPIFTEIMAAHVALCNLASSKRPTAAEKAAERHLVALIASLSDRDRVMLELAGSALGRRACAH